MQDFSGIHQRPLASGSPHDSVLEPFNSDQRRKRNITSMEGDGMDPESTPKAARKRSRRHATAGEDVECEQDENMSAVTSSASTTSSKRSRHSASPIKQINRLAAQLRPLEKLNFSQLEHCPLPKSISSLMTKVRRCAKGTLTIPLSLKDQILKRDPDLDPEDNVWRPDMPVVAAHAPTQYSADMDPNLLPTQSYDVGVLHPHLQTHSSKPRPRDLLPSLLEAEMIVDQAQECQVADDFEAGWNSHVHGPLLVLACHMSQHYKRVRSVNLTLAPCLRQHQRVSITGKMVDFGIYLQPSPVLRDAYKEIEPEADGESRYFNHTNFEQIARKPLAISIETKREDQGGSQADLQLSVWVDAHFDRLAGLRRTALNVDDRSIWLPLLKVIGPIWYLLLARGDYNELGELAGTTVYSRYQLGDVTTYHGFFRVFSAIHALVDWAETSYRPWFERWVSQSQGIESSAA